MKRWPPLPNYGWCQPVTYIHEDALYVVRCYSWRVLTPRPSPSHQTPNKHSAPIPLKQYTSLHYTIRPIYSKKQSPVLSWQNVLWMYSSLWSTRYWRVTMVTANYYIDGCRLHYKFKFVDIKMRWLRHIHIVQLDSVAQVANFAWSAVLFLARRARGDGSESNFFLKTCWPV